MKINNKGFTLVELLAVMVILITISLVAVGGITNSLAKRENKERDEQSQLAMNAAKIYFSLNQTETCVSIQTLKNGGFIKENQKTDKIEGDSVYLDLNGYRFKTGC